MKKLKRSCFMAILLCAALLFAACLSDNASGPEESAGTESLPGESGGENASGPVDAPHMLVCRSLEELSELQSMLEKSEQEVYAYLQASGLGMMAGVSSKAELAALLEKVCSAPVLLPKAETGYMFEGMNYYVDGESLHIGYVDSFSGKKFRAGSWRLTSDSSAADESAGRESADSLTVGEQNISLYLSYNGRNYSLYGRTTASGYNLWIRLIPETVDPKLRGGIECTTLNRILAESLWDKWNTDESELNEEQRQQLEALREEGERKAGRFWYQEMVIFGRVDPAQPKLDLETAKKIIAENTDFETILKEFEKVQLYPDFAGGSGVTNIEYWGGAGTNPQIVIIYEQSQIYGETYNEDGTLLDTELIFG